MGSAASFGLSPSVSVKQSRPCSAARGRHLEPPALGRLDEEVARRAGFVRRAEAPAIGALALEFAEILVRDRARHGGERGVDRAGVGRIRGGRQRQRKPRFGRQADLLAHGEIGVELEHDRLRRVARLDQNRKDDAAVIAERFAAVRLLDALRRWVLGLDARHILGSGKIERWRQAGVAGIAPIGDRARREL